MSMAMEIRMYRIGPSGDRSSTRDLSPKSGFCGVHMRGARDNPRLVGATADENSECSAMEDREHNKTLTRPLEHRGHADLHQDTNRKGHYIGC